MVWPTPDVSDACYYIHKMRKIKEAGATFDWMFFDNSKLIEKVLFLRKKYSNLT